MAVFLWQCGRCGYQADLQEGDPPKQDCPYCGPVVPPFPLAEPSSQKPPAANEPKLHGGGPGGCGGCSDCNYGAY